MDLFDGSVTVTSAKNKERGDELTVKRGAGRARGYRQGAAVCHLGYKSLVVGVRVCSVAVMISDCGEYLRALDELLHDQA